MESLLPWFDTFDEALTWLFNHSHDHRTVDTPDAYADHVAEGLHRFIAYIEGRFHVIRHSDDETEKAELTTRELIRRIRDAVDSEDSAALLAIAKEKRRPQELLAFRNALNGDTKSGHSHLLPLTPPG